MLGVASEEAEEKEKVKAHTCVLSCEAHVLGVASQEAEEK